MHCFETETNNKTQNQRTKKIYVSESAKIGLGCSSNCVENKSSNKSSRISKFGDILREFDIEKSLALL